MIEKGIDLGRRKIAGLATKEHAEAEKNYAEAAKAFTETEDQKIATELKRRTLEFNVRKGEAEVRAAEAEATLKEIQVLDARLELIRKLEAAGMLLHRDDKGNLTIFPKPKDSPSLLRTTGDPSPSNFSSPTPTKSRRRLHNLIQRPERYISVLSRFTFHLITPSRATAPLCPSVPPSLDN